MALLKNDRAPTTTLTTTKQQLKIQHAARAGGIIDMAETDDDMDEDYKTEEDVAESEIDLDVDPYEEVDKYEIKMLNKDNNYAEGTRPFDGDGEEAADEEDGDGDEVEVSIPVDPAQQREIHKRDFYNLYTPYYKKITNTHLIADARYIEILCLLRTKPKTSERGNTRKMRQTYQLVGNVGNRCIYQKGKVVTTFARVFDAILEAHSSIGHSRDPRKHKG